jgi:hypothetical protein
LISEKQANLTKELNMSVSAAGNFCPDTRMVISDFAIETPKDFACLARVSRAWSAACRSLRFQDRNPRHFEEVACPRPTSIPKQIYFTKLNRFFQEGLSLTGHYVHVSWAVAFSGRDILRAVKELKSGLGHTPKQGYSLLTEIRTNHLSRECYCSRVDSLTYPSGFAASKSAKRDYSREGQRAAKTAIAPLDYFKFMSTIAPMRSPDHGFDEHFNKLYWTMYAHRKAVHPEDPQLSNLRFGELAFYDEEGCTSTGDEKAAAVFEVFFKGCFQDSLGR